MVLTYIGLIQKHAEVTFKFKGLETKLERPCVLVGEAR